MKKQGSKTREMCRKNIVAVKVEDSTREYRQASGGTIEKKIRRTRYLKLCWMCGKPYESFKSSSYACSPRCSNNIYNALNNGYEAPARMDQLMKEKNLIGVREKFGY